MRTEWTQLAPVAIFAYRRSAHLRRLLDSLEADPLFACSPVFVFCDGARGDSDRADVEATRLIVRTRMGSRAHVVESATNRGLANSIISGVTELCSRFGRAIVFEDDLVVHPRCLHFLNSALDRFAEDPKVCHINAYRYPLPRATEPCFSRLTCSWGWATWQRAWAQFETDAVQLLARIGAAGLGRHMDVDGSYSYLDMLQSQARNEIDSWAIRWYASTVLSGALALYPSASLASNSGFDASGEHCGVSSIWDVQLAESSQAWPTKVVEDPVFFHQVQDFFRSIRPPLRLRILRRLRLTVIRAKPGASIER
jgi:hypothetical protein